MLVDASRSRSSGYFGEPVGRVALQLSNSEGCRDCRETRCRTAVRLPGLTKVQEADAVRVSAVDGRL